LCYIDAVEELPFKASRRGLKLSQTMGRTSKFSFPLPGRKHASAKDKTPPKSSSGASSILSKAQRILGTDNELNIDSPARDDDVHSWRYPSDRSDVMSISISESTHSIRSTNESGSIHGTLLDQWDHESSVFPRSQRLNAKASSTLLGQRYGDDGATDTSGLSRRIRREDSSSTLKSYYDRQKSPLAISQQTSASSARDLALRKGFPPVIPGSPLLQVESSIDQFGNQFGENYPQIPEVSHHGDPPRDKMSRKKPARLDLSILFPSSRKSTKTDAESTILSSSMLANEPHTPGVQNSNSVRRRLQKAPSKESLQSQKHSIRSSQSQDSRQRQTSDTLYHLYDHYEQLPIRSPHMSQIPESRVPSLMTDWNLVNDGNTRVHPRRDKHSGVQPESKPSRNPGFHQSPSDKESFSWKNVRQSIASPPWEVSSAASVSSRNTKTSRHTSTSVISNSDLKQKSVLSLSSDSEEDTSDPEPVKSPIDIPNNKFSRPPNGTSQKPVENCRQLTQQPAKSQQGLTTRTHGPKKGAAQSTPFLTIPETSSVSARLSGPWSPPKLEPDQSLQKDPRRSSQKEKRSSKKPLSISSKRSSQQPTPPLSPTSVEFREVSERSSRFMAVTKQEEALLSALRQKRARMREEIIEEHETAKSPPHSSSRSTFRYSEASSISTVRGNAGSNGKGQILLYLDTPISNGQPIDTAEPSPDLSDFLSFGSDEDSTPRTSWVPRRKGEPRPDSSVSPDQRGSKFSPRTPPSAARLSAVGAVGGLTDERPIDQTLGAKKRNYSGVRFVDNEKPVNPQDFLLDENETEVIWGM
jgi:hypothetical protein